MCSDELFVHSVKGAEVLQQRSYSGYSIKGPKRGEVEKWGKASWDLEKRSQDSSGHWFPSRITKPGTCKAFWLAIMARPLKI